MTRREQILHVLFIAWNEDRIGDIRGDKWPEEHAGGMQLPLEVEA